MSCTMFGSWNMAAIAFGSPHAIGTAPTFGAIGGLCALVLLWTRLCVPETANRTLEQMESDYAAPDESRRGE